MVAILIQTSDKVSVEIATNFGAKWQHISNLKGNGTSSKMAAKLAPEHRQQRKQ